jgi:hypothetical protein
MSEKKNLAGILHSVAKRMRADFETSQAFTHRGESGAVREWFVRDFVARYLPGHIVATHSAEVITVTGDVSPQCDVVLFDRSTPPMLDMEDYRIIPNECVYGVIEVKTKLDKEQLTDACEKIERLKALPKTAYFPAPYSRTANGKTYPYVPTVSMIFAYDSIDMKTLADHFIDWCASREPEACPDSIWVLGKGYLMWTDAETGSLIGTREPGSGALLLAPVHDEDILFPLVLVLNLHFVTAGMPPLRLNDYAGTRSLGMALHRYTTKNEGGSADALEHAARAE